MCSMALFQVSVRLVLSDLGIVSSVPWSEELGRFAMIWMIFLGAAYAVGSGQMVALQLILQRLPQGARLFVEGIITLVVIGFAGLLIRIGLQMTRFGWIEKSPVLQIDKAFVYFAMPISSALIIIYALIVFLDRLLKYFRGAAHGLDLNAGCRKW